MTDPLVSLGLREVGREPQLGDEDQSLAHGEVRQQAVVLAHVSDALLHQLGRVGLPVNQNLTRLHFTALVPARDYVQQGSFTTSWKI